VASRSPSLRVESQDGYCPLASYIGARGFCLELSLCPKMQHSAKDTQDNLQRVIPLAYRLRLSVGTSVSSGLRRMMNRREAAGRDGL
jgi:hypothetical protein